MKRAAGRKGGGLAVVSVITSEPSNWVSRHSASVRSLAARFAPFSHPLSLPPSLSLSVLLSRSFAPFRSSISVYSSFAFVPVALTGSLFARACVCVCVHRPSVPPVRATVSPLRNLPHGSRSGHRRLDLGLEARRRAENIRLFFLLVSQRERLYAVFTASPNPSPLLSLSLGFCFSPGTQQPLRCVFEHGVRIEFRCYSREARFFSD